MDLKLSDSNNVYRNRAFGERKSSNSAPISYSHRLPSPAHSSTDDKDDDSNNSCPSGYKYAADSFVQQFPVDDQQSTACDASSTYRRRRIKNNEAARKSREKRRRLDAELRRQLEFVIAENRTLRYQLKLLQTACGLPTADEDVSSPRVVASLDVAITSRRSRDLEPISTICSSLLPTEVPRTSIDVKPELNGFGHLVEAANRLERRIVRGMKSDDCGRSSGFINSRGMSTVRQTSETTGDIERIATASSCMIDWANRGHLQALHTESNEVANSSVDCRVPIAQTAEAVVSNLVMDTQQFDAEPLNLSTAAVGSNYGIASKRILCV